MMKDRGKQKETDDNTTEREINEYDITMIEMLKAKDREDKQNLAQKGTKRWTTGDQKAKWVAIAGKRN